MVHFNDKSRANSSLKLERQCSESLMSAPCREGRCAPLRTIMVILRISGLVPASLFLGIP